MLLDGGVGALPKVLEAYMGEAAWRQPKAKGTLHGRWPNVGA